MPAPTVSSVNPPIGPTVGGVSVTLTGADFTGTTGVTIGGVAATNVTVVSDTSITCTIPAGSAGGASVLVTNASGTNAGNSLFFYVAAVPADTHIYLKGGRGDGFVPNWTGHVTEEGMVDSDGVVVGSDGKEVSDPYRDSFVPQGFTVGSSNVHGVTTLTLQSAAFSNDETVTVTAPTNFGGSGGGVAAGGDMKSSTPDEISHTKPRQYFKVFTWLLFLSSNGLTYKFRKADVIGWGGRART